MTDDRCGQMFEFIRNKKNEPLRIDPAYAKELTEQAQSLMERDEPKRALRLYLKAMEIYDTLFGSDPETYRKQTAACADGLGAAYENLEKYSDAYDRYLFSAELLKELADPAHPEEMKDLADAYCNLGDTFFFRNKYDHAEKEYHKALELLYQLVGIDSAAYLEDLAYCFDCLAKSYSGKEDYTHCLEYYDRVIEIYQKLIADHKGSPLDEVYIDLNEELASVYGDIGYIYSCCKKLEQAEDYYLRAASIFRNLAAQDPDHYTESLAAQYEDLAALYDDMNNHELAKEYKKKAQNPDI